MSSELWQDYVVESDHDITLTMLGDVESLRPLLREAVEKLGYKVISEFPIQAKRGAQGGARWQCSFEPLDYPTKLTIGLKQLNNMSVAATFNFEVKSGGWDLSKGDHQTLLREAQAIAALATQRPSLIACPSCGAEVTDDSRFCRRCGSPLAAEIAEVEVWRLTKGARASLHDIVIGVLTVLLAIVIVSLVSAFAGPKVIKIFAIIGAIIGIFGGWSLIEGLWQLYSVLNPGEEKQTVKSSTPKTISQSQQTTALRLPPQRQPIASVTEGTTDLLVSPEFKEPIAIPVERKRVDTSEVEQMN
jgi:hypothetical protein